MMAISHRIFYGFPKSFYLCHCTQMREKSPMEAEYTSTNYKFTKSFADFDVESASMLACGNLKHCQ